MCHGQNGNGKGEVDTGEKLPDFTDPASMKSVSDGEIFCSLKHGKGHMPLERIRITPNELVEPGQLRAFAQQVEVRGTARAPPSRSLLA